MSPRLQLLLYRYDHLAVALMACAAAVHQMLRGEVVGTVLGVVLCVLNLVAWLIKPLYVSPPAAPSLTATTQS